MPHDHPRSYSGCSISKQTPCAGNTKAAMALALNNCASFACHCTKGK
jgi:hypothetical protein